MKLLTKLFIFSLLIISPAFVLADNSFPSFPMAFWGTVKINGSPAPTGTVVKAYYGSILAGTVIVQESGIYGYTESTKQKLIVGEGTGFIFFDFADNTNPTLLNCGGEWNPVSFTSGLTVEENLAFHTTGCGSIGGGPVVVGPTETIPPVITLNGGDVTIYQGSTYTDAGATATDNIDGNISANIITTNSVNSNVVGTYTVTYNVSDATGNHATQVTRTVNVLSVPVVSVPSSGGGGGGGGGYTPPPTNPVIPTTQTDGCVSGNLFSTTNGKRCAVITTSAVLVTPTVIPGCDDRKTGFSVITGQSCVGNIGTTVVSNTQTTGQVLGVESFNFTLTLRMGSKGNEVIELQKFLNNAGYSVGTADGKFGAKTKAAVIKFQIANKLKGDGVVGPKVRALLNK